MTTTLASPASGKYPSKQHWGNWQFKALTKVSLMMLKKNGIQILPITFLHTVRQHQLVFHHRDPFDRIIVAQAIEEDMDLISRDHIFDEYLLGQSQSRIW